MKKIIALILLLITSTVFAQDITGTWNGLLKFPGGQLPLALNITKAESGYTATLDSPEQGAMGIPVATIVFENNNLVFGIPAGNIEYEGKLENNIFKGVFRQNGYDIPLELGRGAVKIEKAKRPQEPVQPYPYQSEDVTFKNDKAGITLAGTLTLPKKEGNFPAVVLISGSGSQNRDEEIMEHKPFLVLSDFLTRNGFAVLRFDDRGVGKSGGNPVNATTADLATDTEAAFNFLKTRKEINKKKIGLVGHSEGGMIAPMVANTNPDVAFIIMLAGPGIPGAEQLVLQNYLIGKADGIPEDELTRLGAINKQVYNVLTTETDIKAMKKNTADILNKEMRPFYGSKGIPESEITQYINSQVEIMCSPWYIYFLKYNPAPAIEKLKCPVLALNGEKDLQVPPNANLDGIKRAAEKGGNKKVTTKKLAGLNHLLQECTTGAMMEYGTIEQTISPTALNEISAWLNKEVK